MGRSTAARMRHRQTGKRQACGRVPLTRRYAHGSLTCRQIMCRYKRPAVQRSERRLGGQFPPACHSAYHGGIGCGGGGGAGKGGRRSMREPQELPRSTVVSKPVASRTHARSPARAHNRGRAMQALKNKLGEGAVRPVARLRPVRCVAV